LGKAEKTQEPLRLAKNLGLCGGENRNRVTPHQKIPLNDFRKETIIYTLPNGSRPCSVQETGGNVMKPRGVLIISLHEALYCQSLLLILKLKHLGEADLLVKREDIIAPACVEMQFISDLPEKLLS